MPIRVRIIGAMAVTMLLVGCASSDSEVRNRPESARTATPGLLNGASKVEARKAGFAVVDGVFTAAGSFFNPSRVAIADIQFRVVLHDEAGTTLGSFRDVLPFCPRKTLCWWSTRFPVTSFRFLVGDTRDIELTVTGDGGQLPAAARETAKIVEFRIDRDESGYVRGRAPEREGMVFLVTFVASRPRGGAGVNVAPRLGSRSLHVPSDILPRVSPNESLRAFMYVYQLPTGA